MLHIKIYSYIYRLKIKQKKMSTETKQIEEVVKPELELDGLELLKGYNLMASEDKKTAHLSVVFNRLYEDKLEGTRFTYVDYQNEVISAVLREAFVRDAKLLKKITPEAYVGGTVEVPYKPKPVKAPAKGISSLLPICIKDEFRPAMQGVYIDAEKDLKRMVVTDAHALLACPLVETEVDILKLVLKNRIASFRKIIPDYTLEQAREAFEGKVDEGLVDIILNVKEGLIVDEKYPKWRVVVPTHSDYHKEFEADGLAAELNGIMDAYKNLEGLLMVQFELENKDFIYFNAKFIFKVVQAMRANGATSISLGAIGFNKALVLESDVEGMVGLCMPIMSEAKLKELNSNRNREDYFRFLADTKIVLPFVPGSVPTSSLDV